MAIKVRLESVVNFTSLVCLLALWLAIVHAMPQEKSFQSDNELVERTAKLLPPYTATSDVDVPIGSGNNIEPTNNLMRSLVFALGKKPTQTNNWLLQQAMSGQHKRQIRYQQCYFNPISCF